VDRGTEAPDIHCGLTSFSLFQATLVEGLKHTNFQLRSPSRRRSSMLFIDGDRLSIYFPKIGATLKSSKSGPVFGLPDLRRGSVFDLLWVHGMRISL